MTTCLLSFCISVHAAAATSSGAPGETAVLKWRDGKKAAFLLAFDDSCQSHVKKAIPELEKRGMVGTFYINPGNGPYRSHKDAWEKDLPKSPAVVYGNHTFTHSGATNTVHLDTELSRCHEVIYACYPERKKPFLVSFGRPGGVPWTVPDSEKKAALAKYNLIERPSFFGYPIHVKSTEALCAVVDKAIAKGEMGHHDFHGVGGDWLVTPMEAFIALLDKLEACKEDVWVTDHITCHKYQTERAGAKVSTERVDAASITVALSSSADSALYDLPLTLETGVPESWLECRIAQAGAETRCAAVNGKIRYEGLPNAGDIVITRLK
jgi:peptidoglycan/xylan/chitin deacetylase (PgdA/CDA1 family)